ncbi:MAG: TonB-dependent receptor [Candidatus Poseidoniia archaeon]|nr:TonB-dependent receptor [Candidatus Poseidoniia archaeon]
MTTKKTKIELMENDQMRSIMNNFVLLGFLIISVFSINTSNAQAQEASDGIEEVVVTARKREENIQETALSVSALSARDIENRVPTDIRDLAADSPNLIIDDLQQGPGSPTAIFIRGVGVSDVEKNFDPTTGVVLDGVFIGANSGAMLKTIDLESVEILRGPQGTLFGRNTVAGVINLTRTKPTGERGGKIKIGYDNYNTHVIDGILNIGTPEAAFKITGTHREQNEGYLTNAVDGQDLGREEYTQITFNSLFQVNDNIEVELTLTDEQQDQDAHTALNLGGATTWWCAVYGQCSPGLGIPQSGDRYTVYNNEPKRRDASFESYTGILELRWELSDYYKLDYIFGRKTTDEEVDQDWDGTPLTLYHTDRRADYEQASHELRLTSDLDGPLNYVVGLYKWDSEYTIPMESRIGFFDLFGAVPTEDPLIVVPVYNYTHQETDSIAVFFEADYDINDQITLTIGGRYIDEEKSSNACQGGGPYPDCGVMDTDADKSWTKFTPKVAVSYQANEDLHFYASYSQGYRSGGFNGRWGNEFSATRPYKPETVTSIEVGVKSTLLDNRLRVNVAIFDMEYEDKQLDVDIPDTLAALGRQTVTDNVAEASFKGIELELNALITQNFSIDLNVGYLDPSYDDFFADFNGSGAAADFTYLEPLRAPDLTWTLGLTYEWEAGPGLAYVRASAHHIGEHHTSQLNSPTTFNKEQTLVDLSMNYEINNTVIALYGKNLTEEDGFTVGYDVFAGAAWSYAMARKPRIWGVSITQSF